MSESASFTPAVGFHWLTPFYDVVISTLTRENVWRSALVSQVRPSSEDRIADLGCGTGSLLLRLSQAAPSARLFGIDPDPRILDRARTKLAHAEVTLMQGFARDAATLLRDQRPTKIVSSLVLHQVPMAEKSAALRAAYEALPSGGELHIADYALQRSTTMRVLFRATVQNFDGVEDTEPQARGILPELIEAAGFTGLVETHVFDTLTGSISLFRAVRT